MISFNPFQALSINKSLLRAKSAAEDGEVHCEKLRNLVIQCITDAGGRVDYAEVRYESFFHVFNMDCLMKSSHSFEAYN